MRSGFTPSTGVAFLVLIALIAGLTLNWIFQLQKLDDQITLVLEHNNRRIKLITQIQMAAWQRTDSLFSMALTDDAFERDAYFMRFNQAGFQVGSGRAALRAAGLNPREQANFDSQSNLIVKIEAVQETVIDLLAAERFTEARELLTQRAIPMQEAFNQRLSDMRNLNQLSNLTAERQVQTTFQQTIWVTLGFGVLAAALATLIAWRTMNKIQQASRTIREHMDALEQSQAALREEATHDALTGLANRRLFYDRLQQAIRHAARYGGKVGLLFVDMDDFKGINDQHGHHVGDAVLLEVARQLTACVRESDSVARLGGDEFVILLDGIQGKEDCLTAARKIEAALSGCTQFAQHTLSISASIGQALYPDNGQDEDTLLRAADAAMYRVKSGSDTDRQRRLAFAQ